MKDRLLIGQRFLNATSNPDFFNLGRTSACFQFSGNTPDSRDRLIILVSTGRRTSKHPTTSRVGIGSRVLDFLLDLVLLDLLVNVVTPS